MSEINGLSQGWPTDVFNEAVQRGAFTKEGKFLDGNLCLGYSEIKLLFNVGPFPGGGDCLIIEADGNVITVNSADLIHDIEAYELYNEASPS
jgi:hypothetical protein